MVRLMIAGFAALLSVAQSTELLQTRLSFKDHVCPDQKQHCLDGYPCCAFDGTGGGYGCCDGGNTEECCADDLGGVCCVSQPTSCIAKSTASSYPARCCPRETVECAVGSVGCCNPARAWQRGAPLNPSNPVRSVSSARDLLGHTKLATSIEATGVSDEKIEALRANASLAYALVVGGFSGKLQALTIDITSGAVVKKVTVSDYNNWGESTRDFAYDGKRNRFYALDVDFVKQATRPSGGRPVTLFSIDPTTGEVDMIPVTGGLVDYVTGYSVDEETGRIHAATQKMSADGKTVAGYSFYWVDAVKGTSKLIGSLSRDSSKKEDDVSYYAGFHRLHGDNGEAVRIGYKYVSSAQQPGLFTVTMGESASTKMTTVPLPKGLDFYLGALRSPLSSTGYLSAAPALSNGFLSIVSWDAEKATTLASFQNVTAPRVTDGGTLGFTLDAARKDVYVALVDANSAVATPFPTAWDQLAIAVVPLSSDSDAKVMKLTPAILSGGTSVSGLGLPSL